MTKLQRDNMVFEELHNRYGTHVARRVQQQLSSSELAKIPLNKLPTWLEARAETAHKDYQAKLGTSFVNEDSNGSAIDNLYRRWQQAEELAFIIGVAEDVSHQARVVAGK